MAPTLNPSCLPLSYSPASTPRCAICPDAARACSSGCQLRIPLRELPSTVNGLSLTEELALSLLAKELHNLIKIYWTMVYSTDPLPGQGDWTVRCRLLDGGCECAAVYLLAWCRSRRKIALSLDRCVRDHRTRACGPARRGGFPLAQSSSALGRRRRDRGRQRGLALGR